jgi:hypothetical protein
MPPYVYVKIILRITSYSTLFILKRNTGNCFYLLSYICLSGIFLEKFRQKTLFRTTRFHLFTHLPFSFRMLIYEWLLAHNSAHALKAEGNFIPVRDVVNRSLDNRGSTLYTLDTTLRCLSV